MNRKDYDLAIRELSCSVCEASPVVPHHIDSKRHHHDLLVIPLCYYHHQGYGGIHKVGTTLWEMWNRPQWHHLRKTLRRLSKEQREYALKSLKDDKRIQKRIQMRDGWELRRILEG